MLRAMHERVAVMRMDASNKRVRQRSASMLDLSVTIAASIEREIATKSPIFAAATGARQAPRQCAPQTRSYVSR